MHNWIFLWKWYFSGHSRVGNPVSLIFPGRQDLPENASSSVLLHKLSQTRTLWKSEMCIKPISANFKSAFHCFALVWQECCQPQGQGRHPETRGWAAGEPFANCSSQTVLVLLCWASEAAQAAQLVARGHLDALSQQPQVSSPAPGGVARVLLWVKCCMLFQRTVGMVQWVFAIHRTASGWRVWLKSLSCQKSSNLDAVVPLVLPTLWEAPGWEHTLCAAWEAKMHVKTIAFFLTPAL